MIRPKHNPPVTALAGLLLGLIAIAAVPSRALDLPAMLEKGLMGEVGDRKNLPEMSGDAPDNSMDPDLYRVGGGDGFQISIKDLPSHEYFPVVNPDGSLYLGDFGEIVLGNCTLTEAKRLIRERMRKALKKNYEVYVTLKKVKKAVITVGGALPSPGTYQMSGTFRLYDALKQANKNEPPAMDKFDLRRVTVRNRDSVQVYDMLRFLGDGESKSNPYVYPGDHVDLAPLDRSITVAGHVLGPVRGRIPLVPGERLSDLLPMLDLKASADSSHLLVQSSDGALARVPRSDAAGTVLRDNDVVIVPATSNYGRQDTVLVTGEVMRPGTYPVRWGRTKASDLLEMAGGPTADGNAKRAFLVRRGKLVRKAENEKEPVNIAWMRYGNPASSVVRPEMSASLTDLSASGDYTLIDLSREPGVVLEGGDEIHVPRVEKMVYVSGQVRNPGAYPYVAGDSPSDYVGKAGGYSAKADRRNQFTMFHYQGITSFKEGGEVREGDVVVVPASVENKRLTTVYLPVLQVLATAVSLAITYIAITNTQQ